ncbi:hypothetical protein [[Mycoplasma] testudinis]|uniref:hypothetical protein n=1 Tax=[Mycoplasma] testudinis TaxID=33924 RepID=UPI0012EB4E87|nr:hypothetical protein [[Mycoplasma] testudinis]
MTPLMLFFFGANFFNFSGSIPSINFNASIIVTSILIVVGIITTTLFVIFIVLNHFDLLTPIKNIKKQCRYVFFSCAIFCAICTFILGFSLLLLNSYPVFLNKWSIEFFNLQNISIPLSVVPMIVNIVLITGIPTIMAIFIVGILLWFLIAYRFNFSLGYLIMILNVINHKIKDAPANTNFNDINFRQIEIKSTKYKIFNEICWKQEPVNTSNHKITSLNQNFKNNNEALFLEDIMELSERNLTILFRLEYSINELGYYVKSFQIFKMKNDDLPTIKNLHQSILNKQISSLNEVENLFQKMIKSCRFLN